MPKLAKPVSPFVFLIERIMYGLSGLYAMASVAYIPPIKSNVRSI